MQAEGCFVEMAGEGLDARKQDDESTALTFARTTAL